MELGGQPNEPDPRKKVPLTDLSYYSIFVGSIIHDSGLVLMLPIVRRYRWLLA
jgi:hypothetical protein